MAGREGGESQTGWGRKRKGKERRPGKKNSDTISKQDEKNTRLDCETAKRAPGGGRDDAPWVQDVQCRWIGTRSVTVFLLESQPQPGAEQ